MNAFFFKKLISGLLLPVPIFTFCLLLGLLLIGFKKCRKLAVTIMVISLIIILSFSFYPLPRFLLNELESQYPPLLKMPANIHTIVVLGGGTANYKNYPPNTRLNSASLARLVEAIRLYRQQPNSSLILSGGRIFGSPIEANVLNNTAIALGAKRSDIKIEKGSRNTHDEAVYLKKYVGNKPFILVTSAVHMPRAMALFKAQGMHPIAAPTQFLSAQYQFTIKYYLPNSINLVYTDIALHEYYGLAWAWLRGYIH